MNKFVRNNQKKLLGIFSAFLMVVFIITLAPSNKSGPGAVDVTVATLNGKKVSNQDVLAAQNAWEVILRTSNPDDPRRESLALALVPDDPQASNSVVADIKENNYVFYLLTAEARQQGISVDPEEVQTAINNWFGGQSSDADEQARKENAANDFLIVRALLARVGNMVKVTMPAQRWNEARLQQAITLNFAGFDARNLLTGIPDPDQAAIQKQFDAFRTRVKGNFGQADDPLGFGYQYPNRVKVQYISISVKSLRDAAIARKTNQQWNTEAYLAYTKDRKGYDELEVAVPTTQPAAAATTQSAAITSATTQGATTQPLASTQPTTEPIAATQPTTEMKVVTDKDLNADWLLHADVVVKELQDQEAGKLAQDLIKDITSNMQSAYTRWKDVQTHNPAATQPVETADSKYEFLSVTLSNLIQQKYGIKPTTEDPGRFETAEQLADLPGIGKSSIPGTQPPLTFPVYAAIYAQPLLTPELKATAQAGVYGLPVMAPSQPMGDAQSNLYIFRITATELSHPAALDDVRDQVIKDCKLAAAYQRALDAARETFAQAQKDGLATAAAGATTRPAYVQTEPFIPNEVVVNNQPIPPLTLAPRSELDLGRAAMDMVSTPPNRPEHPVALVQLYADAEPAVIELASATPGYSSPYYAAELIYRLGSQDRVSLLKEFCSSKNLRLRLNFVPAKAEQPQGVEE